MASALEGLDCSSLNTTECILLAAAKILDEVEKSNNAVNWDPASFAVTLIIGLIALFFAVLTILQGLLAAGPGRVKCSPHAIGTWAALSKHRFNWSELRFRSVAYTPIIDIEHVLESARERSHHYKLRQYEKHPDEDFPASWLTLLTVFRMDHPMWWQSKPQSPDYLPAEFTAVPAYSSVHDLLALVAMGKKARESVEIGYDPESGLPIIRLSNFQGRTVLDLEFRRHPILGIYGVAQGSKYALKYKMPENRVPTAAFECPTNRGVIRLEGVRGNLLSKSGETGWPEPEFVTGYGAVTSSYLRKRIFDLGEAEKSESEDFPHRQDWVQIEWAEWNRTFFESALRGADGGLSLLTASAADEPAVFPWKSSTLPKGLQGLVVLSRFWSCRDKARAPAYGLLADFQPNVLDTSTVFRFFDYRLGSEPLSSDLRASVQKQMEEIDDFLVKNTSKTTLWSRILSLGCSSAVYDYLSHGRSFPFEVNKGGTTIPLPDIDGLQEHSFGMEPTVQVIETIMKSRIWTISAKFLVQGIRSLSDLTSNEFYKIEKLWEWDGEKKNFKYHTREVEHPVDDLLIFRAILAAVAISGAVDNSDIIENPAYRKQIPIL